MEKTHKVIEAKAEKEIQVKQRKLLFKKTKNLLRAHISLVEFDEPVGILLRRNRRAEFYEGLKKGKFSFRHSDGTERFIMLDPRYLQIMPYGMKSTGMAGYIMHEDFPTPIPEDPVLTIEQSGEALEKVMNDVRDLRAKEYRAKGEMWWKILLGVAILGAVYVLYGMLVDKGAPPVQVTVPVVQNITATVLG